MFLQSILISVVRMKFMKVLSLHCNLPSVYIVKKKTLNPLAAQPTISTSNIKVVKFLQPAVPSKVHFFRLFKSTNRFFHIKRFISYFLPCLIQVSVNKCHQLSIFRSSQTCFPSIPRAFLKAQRFSHPLRITARHFSSHILLIPSRNNLLDSVLLFKKSETGKKIGNEMRTWTQDFALNLDSKFTKLPF